MKKLFTIIFLISAVASFSQSAELIGEYFLDFGEDNHRVEHKLILNREGTFTFHSYSNVHAGLPQIVHQYGRGNWSLDKKVVYFFTNQEKDIDEKYTLDFGGSKARFITKPARDKTDRIVQTRLQFFDSGIFWVKRLELFRIITSIDP